MPIRSLASLFRRRAFSQVITGFNTDIEFEGKKYHVQTEDKGTSKSLILSLVYTGGTILASRRTPYDDLLNGGLDEKALSERLNKQHRTICAAITAGRIDDLIRVTKKAGAKAAVAIAEIPEPTVSIPEVIPPQSMTGDSDPMPPIPMPSVSEASNDDRVFDMAILEEEVIISDEAVEIVSEMEGRDRPSNSRLTVELLGDSRFRGGEHRSVSFMVCRGSDRKVVPSAQIMVKILGSSFRPLIFHAKSDANGIARVNLQFPIFSDGRAALVIRAMSDGEEVELRRVVAGR